jgi:hypothetical protein
MSIPKIDMEDLSPGDTVYEKMLHDDGETQERYSLFIRKICNEPFAANNYWVLDTRFFYHSSGFSRTETCYFWINRFYFHHTGQEIKKRKLIKADSPDAPVRHEGPGRAVGSSQKLFLDCFLYFSLNKI